MIGKEPTTLAEQLVDESSEAMREIYKMANHIGQIGHAMEVLGLPVGVMLMRHAEDLRKYASQGAHALDGYLAAAERGSLYSPPIKRDIR